MKRKRKPSNADLAKAVERLTEELKRQRQIVVIPPVQPPPIIVLPWTRREDDNLPGYMPTSPMFPQTPNYPTTICKSIPDIAGAAVVNWNNIKTFTI